MSPTFVSDTIIGIFIYKCRMSIRDWLAPPLIISETSCTPICRSWRGEPSVAACPCVETLPPANWVQPLLTLGSLGSARRWDFGLLYLGGRICEQCGPRRLNLDCLDTTDHVRLKIEGEGGPGCGASQRYPAGSERWCSDRTGVFVWRGPGHNSSKHHSANLDHNGYCTESSD